MHPAIKEMMAGVYARDGFRVPAGQVLRAGGKNIASLPRVGDNATCWNHAVGECGNSSCPYKRGHVSKNQFTPELLSRTCSVLRPCVEEYLKHPKGAFRPPPWDGKGRKRKERP